MGDGCDRRWRSSGRENKSGIAFMGIVRASQEVKISGITFDYVHAQTTAQYRAQVEELQGIVIEIAVHEAEQAMRQIMVIARPAPNGIRSGVRRCRGQIVGGIYRGCVKNQLVAESGTDGIECNIQILGLAVAAGEGKTKIQAAIPALQKAGVQGLLVSRLFGG